LLRVALTVLAELEVSGRGHCIFKQVREPVAVGISNAPLMLVLASSAAVNLPARHASNFELTLMVTRPCAVLRWCRSRSAARDTCLASEGFHRFSLVAKSPSSKVTAGPQRRGADRGVGGELTVMA